MSFDLNIDNYTKKELVEMFELPSYYDKNIVEMQETKLKDSIINNREINTETRNKTVQFLIKAKNIILSETNPFIEQKKEQVENQNRKNIEKNIAEIYNTDYKLRYSNLENPEQHMVQNRENIPFIYSYPSEYFQGIINPIRKKTILQVLNIDTRFRENYYSTSSTNFHINLPTNFNNVLTMQLSSMEFPITYYSVSKQFGNNYFSIKINDKSAVVFLPDGNYDASGIISVINNQISLLGDDFADIVFAVNINGNSGSGQVMVGLNGILDPPVNFELNFQADKYGNEDKGTPLPLKLGWLLGFRNGIYINNQNYVSEGICDVTGPRYIYLVVDDYNNNVNNGFYSAFNSSILNKNILARIALQSNVFTIQVQNNLNVITTPRNYFGPVNLLNLNIQILDEYGRVIDLNNMDYSFCLTLTTVYDI
jgi:hypothetical protein